MAPTGSPDGDDHSEDDLSREDLTDLDEDLLGGSAEVGQPGDAGWSLRPEDFTDLDDAVLLMHREEDLIERYPPVQLAAIAAVHFLPALVGVVPVLVGLDTSSLAPSLGLDLFFLTGFVVFFSGVSAHIVREVGAQVLLRYAIAAILVGSAGFGLALVNAVVAPGAFLTAGGFVPGFFQQTVVGVLALVVSGGLLVVARLAYEFATRDRPTPITERATDD